MEVAWSLKGIFLNQRKYALEIFQDAGYLVAKPASFFMEQNLKINRHDKDLLQDPTIFRRLLYLTITWLDMSFFVHRLKQYIDKPRQPHLQVAYHIF